jgi:hypothetical protein
MDAGDTVLYERCFELTFQSEETAEPLVRSGFVLEVPNPGNVAKAVLVRNDGGQEQELTSLEVSTNAPILTITSPKAGDNWAGEHTITWSGSDEDGDTLRYDVLYSHDGKKTWFPLEVGSNESEYTFSTDEILPSDQTYIRVAASDGFNTTSTDVGPLVVPKQPNSPGSPSSPGTVDTNQPVGGTTAQGGGLPGWGLMAIIGGVLAAGVLVVGVFILTRSSRRPAQSYPAGASVAPPAYPQARPTPPPPTVAARPYYSPVAPHTQPLQPPQPPAGPNPFQRVQMEHGRLQGELAAGRISRQQYEAAVNAMRVQDQSGRYWMLGAYDGIWYYYDGRSWVRTNV